MSNFVPFYFFVHVASQFRVSNFFEKNVQKKFESVPEYPEYPPPREKQATFQIKKKQ